MSFEVIIIGGGLGGLTTGALLAHHGKRVLVLEQHVQLGGRARSEEQHGFLLGAGPSFTLQTTHSPCAEILRRIGTSIPFVETRRPLCWVDRGGRLQPHPLPGIPGALSRSGLLPWSAMFSTRALHARVMSMRPEEAWDIPLGIWANSYVRHPATRRFLFETAQFFHLAAQVDDLSTGYVIESYQHAVDAASSPCLWPAGGWNALFRVCRERIEEAGGEVRTGSRVEQIELSDREVIGVHVDGQRLTAQAYVVAIPIQHLRGLIQFALERVKFKVAQWTRIEPTAGVSLDLGVDGIQPGNAGVIFIPEDRVVIACPSLWDSTVAPPGAHLLHAIRLMTPQEIEDDGLVEQSKRLLLDRIERHVPGATGRIALKRFTVQRMIGGVRHRQGQSRPHLIPFQIPDLANLFFAGDTTAGAGELSDIAFNSALRCTELILEYRMRQGVAAGESVTSDK